jgi:hypothetical protein
MVVYKSSMPPAVDEEQDKKQVHKSTAIFLFLNCLMAIKDLTLVKRHDLFIGRKLSSFESFN